MWNTGSFIHCWGEGSLVQPLWETIWSHLVMLNVHLAYDPAIFTPKSILQRNSYLCLRGVENIYISIVMV